MDMSSFFNFYTIVLLIAIVITILCLAYVGWLMQAQSAGSTFPPAPPTHMSVPCPDKWDKITVDTKTYCLVPPYSSNDNVGSIYDNVDVSPGIDAFVYSMTTSFPDMLYKLTTTTATTATTPPTIVAELLKMTTKPLKGANTSMANANSATRIAILFPTDPCKQHAWAIKYDINWNGISNYYSPSCAKK